ncbi:MAG: hypothetical protein QGF72_06520, partial [Candidatus Poseidoniaceae archaeon]|nr:hypothetical protein [Candidatus Poseidoniaceae archaeon]
MESNDKAAFANHGVEWVEEFAGSVLGLLPPRDEMLSEKVDPRRKEISEQVEELLMKRADARASKDWPAADSIRD